jgi:c-di-GMP-related signal transduction protein
MPEEIDGDTATPQLLSSSFFTIGIDTLTNGKYAFINFTEKLINIGIPNLFPWKRTVIEVLETVPATPEVIRALSSARRKGYTMALDDFILNSAWYGLKSPASSLKDALRMLGLDEIRHLIGLIVMSKIASSAPEEMLRTSAVRGRLFELAVQHSSMVSEPPETARIGLHATAPGVVKSSLH